MLDNYSLRISKIAATRLKSKAEAKGLTLDNYLKNLMAFAEAIDNLSNDDSILILRTNKNDENIDVIIPLHLLGHR